MLIDLKSYSIIRKALNSGINIYIDIPHEKLTLLENELLKEINAIKINSTEELESIAPENILFGLASLLSNNKKNSVICFGVGEEKFIEECIKIEFKEKRENINLPIFKDRIQLFEYISKFSFEELTDFININSKLINEFNYIKKIINEKCDLKLVKVKLVEMWKY